jgi:hypothetical protein
MRRISVSRRNKLLAGIMSIAAPLCTGAEQPRPQLPVVDPSPPPSFQELTDHYCAALLSGQTSIAIPRVKPGENSSKYKTSLSLAAQLEQIFLSNCLMWQQQVRK